MVVIYVPNIPIYEVLSTVQFGSTCADGRIFSGSWGWRPTLGHQQELPVFAACRTTKLRHSTVTGAYPISATADTCRKSAGAWRGGRLESGCVTAMTQAMPAARAASSTFGLSSMNAVWRGS